MSVWSIILTAGNGTRMNCDVNKTLLPLAGECSLSLCFRVLKRHCEGIIVVLRPEDRDHAIEMLRSHGMNADHYVFGGKNRQESVHNALPYLPDECDIVLIHDGARPLIDDNTVVNVIESTKKYGTGIASTPVYDTIKIADQSSIVLSTPARESLRAVQTPQGFEKSIIIKAHESIKTDCTDDSSLVAMMGIPIHLVEGNPHNIKLTTKEDLFLASYYLHGDQRIGHGFDAHRLADGRQLILGGVNIHFEKGLLGHSDADVLIHAVIDALLGAAALGDIGKLFPDSDPQFKGISSMVLLKEAVSVLKDAHYSVGNIDATLIAQRPRLSPHIPEMQRNISGILGISVDHVSIKATTTEGMGYEGTGEGISSHAVAVIYRNL